MNQYKNISESEIQKALISKIDQNITKTIIPGEDYIPVSGKVLDRDDILHGIDATMDAWLTSGRYTSEFEKNLNNYIGSKNAILVNSGSSANLAAFYSLTSPSLRSKALLPGDEIITVAAGFPTTINPLIQFGCIPVFVDISLPTYNIDITKIEVAIGPKTKGIMIAHALGNPFNLEVITQIAKQHNLWLIEDNCDALGAEYQGKKTGTFGDLATLSFYPAHHITMGEGGAVLVNNRRLNSLVLSFRDWGRDCYCEPGEENTCKKRFEWQQGKLPYGYDHKYIYSHIGFNMKITDMQAACGLGQLENLEIFIEKRKTNVLFLKKQLSELQDEIHLPEAEINSDPSWFGFPITIKKESKFKRTDLIKELTESKIGTRLLFSGNLTKQPAYLSKKFIVHGKLDTTDLIMNNTFWVGIQPAIGEEELSFIAQTIKKFFKK